jgi:acyl-CoA synthetase (NDP forming)
MAFKEAPTVDVILSCFLVSRIWTINVNRLLSELEQFPVKPMVAWVIGDYSRVEECTKILEENRVPVFASPERAVRALGALWKYKTLSKQ